MGYDGDKRDRKITIRISSETKQEWLDEVVDNPSVPESNMAAAVRQAMTKWYELGDNVRDRKSPNESVEASVDLSPVRSDIAKLGDSIDELQTLLESDEDSIRTHPEVINDVEQSVYPVFGEMTSVTKAATGSGEWGDADIEMRTPDSIARHLDEDPDRVREALGILENEEKVDFVEESGHKRYFLIDENRAWQMWLRHRKNTTDLVDYLNRADGEGWRQQFEDEWNDRGEGQ